MAIHARTIIAFAALACCLAGVARAETSDDAAIRQLESGQAAAWNAHDAQGYARAFAADADVITLDGWWWQGREAVAAKLTQGFAFVYAQSSLDIEDVAIRPLAPDQAIVHVRWSMAGAKHADGSGGGSARRGIQTQVLTRTAQGWQIVSQQDTAAALERPFATVAAPVAAPARDPASPPKRCLLANRKGECIIGK